MTFGDFSSKNGDVDSGRQLPDSQDELKVTPKCNIIHLQTRPDKTSDLESAVHRSPLKYHDLVSWFRTAHEAKVILAKIMKSLGILATF